MKVRLSEKDGKREITLTYDPEKHTPPLVMLGLHKFFLKQYAHKDNARETLDTDAVYSIACSRMIDTTLEEALSLLEEVKKRVIETHTQLEEQQKQGLLDVLTPQNGRFC